MLQFCQKLQIGDGQVFLYPLVDSDVQLWTEMIFPVTRFTWIIENPSIIEERAYKGVAAAFSVSQLFITSHTSSDTQVVPDNNL